MTNGTGMNAAARIGTPDPGMNAGA
jgi:hypothetical protein